MEFPSTILLPRLLRPFVISISLTFLPGVIIVTLIVNLPKARNRMLTMFASPEVDRASFPFLFQTAADPAAEKSKYSPAS
jgi:hypothetical protein